MKILRSNQVREVDTYTIENEPILDINLMERAAAACTAWITKEFDVSQHFKIFAGPGNNGGDALAIARMLIDRGYSAEVFTITEKLSDSATINYQRLEDQGIASFHLLKKDAPLPVLNPADVVIDGLFGSGLSRSLKEFPAQVVQHINNSSAAVISIDIPSGLFAEDSEELNESLSKKEIYPYLAEYMESPFSNAIKATYTLTLEMPFLTFFFPETEQYVGQWEVLPIGLSQKKIAEMPCNAFYITHEMVQEKLIVRRKFSHKGVYGHALLVSGTYGKMGAAVLASKACLRTGVGLLTTHIPKLGYEIMQTAIPEAMLSIDKYDKVLSSVPNINSYSVIGIGPGIGKSNATQQALREVMEKTTVPIVFDADAINILAENPDFLDKTPPNSIFTPHPKEFERLTAKSDNSFTQQKLQTEFAQKYKSYVVLKGAHTSIACPDGSIYFNSTGNPGMATGGSGDVLTGIILSLVAQGYTSQDAAILGVYLHGLAGDLAANELSEEALIAGDIINYIGKAYVALTP